MSSSLAKMVGTALRDPGAGKDLWGVFRPHLMSSDAKERWLALDCLHDALRTAKPTLPDGDVKNFERTAEHIRDGTATKINNGNSDGQRDKEAAYALLGDKDLWAALKDDSIVGSGGGYDLTGTHGRHGNERPDTVSTGGKHDGGDDGHGASPPQGANKDRVGAMLGKMTGGKKDKKDDEPTESMEP